MNQNYEIIGEQLVVNTDIPVLSLCDMEITYKVNEHGTLVLIATLSEEQGEDILRMDWSDSRISVLKQDDREPLLFSGKIESMEFTKNNWAWEVQVKGAGESVALDKIPKKRSFQNTEMTYMHIVNNVTIGYTDIAYAWNVDKSRTLGQPVIQYEETDWAFLKRLCSHFHGVLVPGSGQETFSFGMGQGRRRDFEQAEILGQGFDGSYFDNGSCEDGLPRDAAFYLEVRTRENWQTGDWVVWNDRRYQVYEKTVTYRNGELLICCRLGAEGTFYQKKLYNEKLAGVRLDGTVRKTQEEDVYIQLDIDEKECSDYPWPWTPETNNISYCMPEPGMKAVLYLETQEEKDGTVVLAGRRTRLNRLENERNKWFESEYHKAFVLYPGHIIGGTDDGKKIISLSDKLGIALFGNSDVLLMAQGNVQISGKTVSMESPVAVAYQTTASNIEICRDFNFYAPSGIQTIGTGECQGKSAGKVKKQGEKREKDIVRWQSTYAAIAAVPFAGLRRIEGVETLVDLGACGCVPKVAKALTVIALTEVMEGKKDSECSCPEALQAMEQYVVKGGYAIPER
ncbi:MAG: hypothetical protein K2N73_00410 [Lachnospiraceae bacterium]|nr:hypothetical protein [Lachnospiraceae bacterium]